MSSERDKAQDILFVDFAAKDKKETFKRDVLTIERLSHELNIPTLAEIYNKGEEETVMSGGEGIEAFLVSVIPFNERITPNISDKGFRLRVSMTGLDEVKHSEIFFNDVGDGLFYQSGFYRPVDEHGGMIYPKLVNETLKAFVRRLVEYKPKDIDVPDSPTAS